MHVITYIPIILLIEPNWFAGISFEIITSTIIKSKFINAPILRAVRNKIIDAL